MSNQTLYYKTRCEELQSDETVQLLNSSLNKLESLEKKVKSLESQVFEKEKINHDLMVVYGTAISDKEKIRDEYRKLDVKYNKLVEEMREKMKSIELINDKVIELQFENNILNNEKLKNNIKR